MKHPPCDIPSNIPDAVPTEPDAVPTAHGTLRHVVALAAPASGLQAISMILADLPASFPAPIVIVPHLPPHSLNQMARRLKGRTALRVKEAEEADRLQGGTVYLAPPAWHLVVHPDETLALSNSELSNSELSNSELSNSELSNSELSNSKKVHRSRPSADALFASLASSLGPRAIGVVLNGGDGAEGIQAIKAVGGITLAQDEQSRKQSMPRSKQESMPRSAAQSALQPGAVDYVLPLPEVAAALIALTAAEPDCVLTGALEVTPLFRVQDASVRARARLSNGARTRFGSGEHPRDDGQLVTQTFAELKDFLEALSLAEQALRDQNAVLEYYQRALREERVRYNVLFQTASANIIATDSKGLIQAVSPTAAELLGKNPNYMVGKSLFSYARQDQHLALDSIIAEATTATLRAGEQAQEQKSGFRLRTRNGRAPVSAALSAVEADGGVVIGLLWRVCPEGSAGGVGLSGR